MELADLYGFPPPNIPELLYQEAKQPAPSRKTLLEEVCSDLTTAKAETEYEWPQDDFEPHTQRAVNEAMDISLLSKVAATRYSPYPETGTKWTSSASRVPVPTDSSEHLRVAASICVGWITKIKRGRVPRPNGQFPATSE